MKSKNIHLYFHCQTCLSGDLAVGWTEKGLQVWCEKCDKNVVDLDFLGQKVKVINDKPRCPKR